MAKIRLRASLPAASASQPAGDTYLRTLLVNGARAVVGRSAHNSWLERLLQRRHFNVVVAALANKMARTAWAVLVKGKAFDPLKWNPTEVAAT